MPPLSDPTSLDAYGNRTLLETFDYIAWNIPEQVFVAVPISSSPDDGFRDVTYNEVGKAVDAFADEVERKYGTSNNFATSLFIGGSFDLRYALAFFAFQKLGFKARVRWSSF